jgi:peptide/nickel transport system ATP-binding protein
VRHRSRQLRRRIQYIFQNPDASLNPRARIGATLARPIDLFFNARPAEIRERVAAALHDVRLDAGYARRYPDELSGGERQRVAIARALVCEPDLLLCDEILSALDVSVQANILAMLKRLRVEHGISMLFISHDLAVVKELADEIAVLYRGELMECGPTDAILTPPYHPYTHSLLMAVPGLDLAGRTPPPLRQSPAPPPGIGCAFAGRCPWKVGEICDRDRPPWRETVTGSRLRCHIPLDELAERALWRPGLGQPSRTRPIVGRSPATDAASRLTERP